MTLYSLLHVRLPCQLSLYLCVYIVCSAHNLHTLLSPPLSFLNLLPLSLFLSLLLSFPSPPPPFLLPLIPLPPLFSVPLSPLHYLPFSLSLLFPPSLRSKCFPHLLNSTTFSTCVISLGSGRGCCMFNMRHVPMWRVSWHCGSMSVPGPLLTGSPTTRYIEIWWTSLAFIFDLAYYIGWSWVPHCFNFLQDVSWFLRAVERVVKEELEVGELQLEPYFVDFLQEAPEPTGEEPEDADMEAPKVYEQV